MSTTTESVTRATSADFGKTTDDVKVKMPDKVIVPQLEKQKKLIIFRGKTMFSFHF